MQFTNILKDESTENIFFDDDGFENIETNR